jgi:hypothetical protein
MRSGTFSLAAQPEGPSPERQRFDEEPGRMQALRPGSQSRLAFGRLSEPHRAAQHHRQLVQLRLAVLRSPTRRIHQAVPHAVVQQPQRPPAATPGAQRRPGSARQCSTGPPPQCGRSAGSDPRPCAAGPDDRPCARGGPVASPPASRRTPSGPIPRCSSPSTSLVPVVPPVRTRINPRYPARVRATGPPVLSGRWLARSGVVIAPPLA